VFAVSKEWGIYCSSRGEIMDWRDIVIVVLVVVVVFWFFRNPGGT